MAKIQQVDIEKEAVGIVKREKESWETATAFVTEKVAFQMRNLIRQLRKNYYGVFDELYDSTTGRKRIWVPLTESIVESVVKNIDLDTKDINFRAKKPEAIGLTGLVRGIVKNKLDEMYFGEYLDEAERQLAIDGTFVWKTFEGFDPETKRKSLQLKTPDLLNCYIDPTARSIQEAYRFTERGLLSEDEVKTMDGWINAKEVEGSEGLSRTDELLSGAGNVSGTTKLVDVWEMWGKIPKYLITGNKKDTEEIEGHIVVSGLERSGKERVHLVEENKKMLKPYEEAWYTRVPGRWYGKGIAEKLLWLQLWANIIVNIRINRSYVSQLGIFKIKKGAGVTPQMLSRLAANGAVTVNSMDDIEQFVMKEASEASYKDEDVIYGWSQRVTSAFETAIGEALPASTPATNAAIQSRAGQSQFVLIKEGIGMFLQRWIKRQALPILIKGVKREDVIRITGEVDELRAWDERIACEIVYRELERVAQTGLMVDPYQVDAEKQRVMEKLSALGKDRYIKLLNDIDVTAYDVQVYVSNEEIDKGVLTQNLISALQAAPEYKDQILERVFDVMGLDPFKKPQVVGVGVGGAGGQIQPAYNSQALLTEANTIQ